MDDILKSFPTFLERLGGDNAAVEQMVFAAFRRCVDGALAKNVVPLRLEGKRLVAGVPNETWHRQVADLGPALAERINRNLGVEFVRVVRFQIDADAVDLSKERISLVAPKPMAGIASPDLQKASESITDESLRSLFLSAATSSLARGSREINDL